LFNAFANVTRDMFSDTANVQLGMAAPLMFANDATKALATFGAFEGLAFTLAGTFSAIFVKASGTGFSRYGQDSLRQTGSSGRGHANESSVGAPAGYSSRLARDTEGMANAENYGAQLRTTGGQGEMIMNSQAKFHRDRLTMTGARDAFGNGVGDYGAAGSAMADANMIKQRMGVQTAESVRAQAAARGLNEQQALAAVTDYAHNSTMGEAMAFSKLASNLGLDSEQTMDFMKGVHASAGLGNAEGLHQSYQNARDNNEFSGNFKDYVGMQKELEASKGFIDKSMTHQMAQKYYNCNERAFLKDQAAYSQATTASQLSTMNENSTGVESMAHMLGQAKAIENIARVRSCPLVAAESWPVSIISFAAFFIRCFAAPSYSWLAVLL
jgi:hypothetical protein